MVYGVVHASGGVISVRSAPGEGTRFELLLPEAQSTETTEAIRPRAVAPRSQPEAPSKLLLAEDDYGVRASLSQALRLAGFSVVEVADVQSGLEQLQLEAQDAEILVTDGIMPGGPTSDLIAKFLALHPAGRVILCSGYVDDELSPRNLGGARFEFLPKPFAPSELVEKLQQR
jgi:two-component system cell cycle sensor histidine kinase/response regulator CckA